MACASAPSHPWEMPPTIPPRQYRQQVGERIRIAIDAIGISYAEAASQMGIYPSKLGNWMRGDNYPDPLILTDFASRHLLTTDWFYRGVVAGLPEPMASAVLAAEAASMRAAAGTAAESSAEDSRAPDK